MHHVEDDPDDWLAGNDWPSEETPTAPALGGCLADMATIGLTLLSMAGGILTSCLALGALLQPQAGGLPQTLNLAALPLACSLLLRGFAGQALVAFGLVAGQFYRQARAVVPGMLLVGLVAVLLLLIALNA